MYILSEITKEAKASTDGAQAHPVRLAYQPPARVLFSQNKPAINNQPTVLFTQNKSAPAKNRNQRAYARVGFWEYMFVLRST
jgi:hypothetical protein